MHDKLLDSGVDDRCVVAVALTDQRAKARAPAPQARCGIDHHALGGQNDLGRAPEYRLRSHRTRNSTTIEADVLQTAKERQ
jgi:hypothetical protein